MRQGQEEKRADWLLQRRQGIGGSDAPAILGLSRWRTPLDVFADKVGYGDNVTQTEAMEWGLLLEPVLLAQYAARTGRTVDTWPAHTVWCHDTIPWLRCTPDGFAVREDGALGCLQLKTASVLAEREWEEEEPPVAYQVQLQHEMAATGCSWGALVCLCMGYAPKLRYWEVARDDAFIEKLLAQEAVFWKRVQDQDPPPPFSPEDQANWLRRFYPVSEVLTVTLPSELVGVDAALAAIRARKKVMETEETELENRIKAVMADAEVGLLPGVRYAWKTSKSGARPFKRSEKA